MKNQLKTISILFPLLCLCCLFSCTETQDKTQATNQTIDTTQAAKRTPQNADVTQINDSTIIKTLSKEVMTSLKNKDYKAFTAFFHPKQGVRFSPYTFVDTTSDLTFTADAFLKQVGQKKKLNWGPYSAGEEDIKMTMEKYFSVFVYNADFLNPEKFTLNEVTTGGATTNNIPEIYPNCPFSESYFSGFDKKMDGMDWCLLRLVFKKEGDKYYLVGVVHDNWTP